VSGQPVAHDLGWRLSTLPRRLESYLAQWPLWPPSFWSRRALWVGWGLLVWTVETFAPATVHTVALGLVSVLLAAWAGSLAWSLGLACALPWGAWVSWWWWGAPWPWWVEVVNRLGEMIEMVGAAILMTAVQRHAVRLALERDPRLARQQGQRGIAGSAMPEIDEGHVSRPHTFPQTCPVCGRSPASRLPTSELVWPPVGKGKRADSSGWGYYRQLFEWPGKDR
jgi:hypothetical protein